MRNEVVARLFDWKREGLQVDYRDRDKKKYFFFKVIDEEDKAAWFWSLVMKLNLVIGCLSWFVGDGNGYVKDGGDEREARKNIFG